MTLMTGVRTRLWPVNQAGHDLNSFEYLSNDLEPILIVFS